MYRRRSLKRRSRRRGHRNRRNGECVVRCGPKSRRYFKWLKADNTSRRYSKELLNADERSVR